MLKALSRETWLLIPDFMGKPTSSTFKSSSCVSVATATALVFFRTDFPPFCLELSDVTQCEAEAAAGGGFLFLFKLVYNIL